MVRTTGTLPVLLFIVMARSTGTFKWLVYVRKVRSPMAPYMTLLSIPLARRLLLILSWPVT